MLEEKQKQDKLKKLYDEAGSNLIESPTIEEFLDKEARGLAAITKYQDDDHDRREHEEEMARILEAEQDKASYKKELLARMFGGKLSTRQYEVLMNMDEDERALAKQQSLGDFKTFTESKDEIRVAEEFIESYRRRKVVDGEWAEEDSHHLMQQQMDEINVKFPSKTKWNIHVREKRKAIQNLHTLRSSEALFEREYYFDEGLGESLNDHTSTLKKDYPGITVQTRRDRDGLPIVKLIMKPTYKYNLDDLIN